MKSTAELQQFRQFLLEKGHAEGHWSDGQLQRALTAGHLVIQDPSSANAEAGGRLPDHLPDSIQDFGKLLVREEVFDSVWHDMDATGKILVRFGIAVGPKQPPATATSADEGSQSDAPPLVPPEPPGLPAGAAG